MIRKSLLLLVVFPTILAAQYERPGSATAQFLKIGISPRATAMGDAFVSAVNGAEAAYYNSAALATLAGTDIVFQHNEWFSGINHDFAAIARTISGAVGTVALSMTALYTDEMRVRTPLQPDGTGETFYAGNYRLGLTYARSITDRVHFGGTINYINMALYSNFNADAWAMDIGVLYTSNFRDFTFGMQIANFGSDVTFVNEAYPLPTNFSFGLNINAFEQSNNKLIFAAAATKPNDGAPLAGIGLEYNLMDHYFLRAGYRLNHEVAKYAFGGGLKIDVINYALKFDYSYTDFSLLGGSHRVGIGFGF
ncbi:MAG: hypothetical protein DWQ10_11155 [Calditrichaeota bacterium]|nr:MAG: hypothetical protein DWQ10_11155 [Calditrichota bacterium]